MKQWRSVFQAVWLGGIGLTALLSLTPAVSMLNPGFNDKLGHFAAYLFISMSGYFSFRHGRPAVLAGLSMIGLGLCLEVCQLWVPGRYFETLDIAANTAGALLGVLFGVGLRRSQAVGVD